jgi:radical SAM superfamily enzyme YgiQ (UPF0313 family)
MPGTLRSPDARPRPTATVTLLRPPVVVLPGALATHGPTPPIGAAYVAAALREAGHTVSLVDGAGEAIDQTVEIDSPVGRLEQIGLSLDEIVDRIHPDTDVVGITTMFLHEWPLVRELAARVKARHPDVFCLLGGENATAFAPWILEQSDDVDACVLGEGEATMVAIADRLAEGKPLHGLSGIAFRDPVAGAVVDTGLSIRMTKPELNAGVPLPAWDLVPLQNYWDHYPFFGVNRGRSMNVLGTRGCPYKCTFCSSPQMWTTKYVVREPEDVVDEIVGYVEQYGIRNVNFVDLTAATNRRWTLGLCDALEARAPGVSWQLPVGTRIEAIDREVLQRLWDTGCRNVTFAPESGSTRLLEVMDKRVKLDKVLDAVRDGNQIGLRTMINILIGHPEETWADLRKSVRFTLKAAWLGCSDTAVMMFCPYPGSADFEALVASGRHEIDEAAYYVGLSRGSAAHRSWNDHISARQLRLMQLVMIAGFYVTSWVRRPWRALAFLRSQLGGAEDTYLDQMVRTKRKNLDHVSRRDERRARQEARPVADGEGDGSREPALAKG